MKIVHLAHSDLVGGSAKTSFRIHQGLNEAGEESILVVRRKISSDTHVSQFGTPDLGPFRNFRASCDNLMLKLNKPQVDEQEGTRSLNVLPSRVAPFINSLQPDVVLVHWIGAGSFSIGDLAGIKAPLVWRLADEWPYCGIHHFLSDKNFERMIRGDILSSHSWPLLKRNFDACVWKNKMKHRSVFRNVIAPSRWIMNRAHQSPLFCNSQIVLIHNPTNCDSLVPERATNRVLLQHTKDDEHFFGQESGQSQRIARSRGTEQGPRIVFVSSSDIEDPRKRLADVLSIMPELQSQFPNVSIRLIGPVAKRYDLRLDRPPFQILGHLSEFKVARELSEADAVVIPSTQEGLPQVALEALSAGCPVVGYSGSPLDDVVVHGATGYLAKHESRTDLLSGLRWVITQPRADLRAACRADAVKRFSFQSVIPKYQEYLHALSTADHA